MGVIIKPCCDLATEDNLGSHAISVTCFCPVVISEYRCGGLCDGLLCTPGEPPDPLCGGVEGACQSADCCGSGTQTISAGLSNYFWNAGAGGISISFNLAGRVCSSEFGNDPCYDDTGVVFGLFTYQVRRVGSAGTERVVLNTISSADITERPGHPGEFFTTGETGGSISLYLATDDHDNPDNDGIWKSCQRYLVEVTADGMGAADYSYPVLNPRNFKTLDSGFNISAVVTSSCCPGNLSISESL